MSISFSPSLLLALTQYLSSGSHVAQACFEITNLAKDDLEILIPLSVISYRRVPSLLAYMVQGIQARASFMLDKHCAVEQQSNTSTFFRTFSFEFFFHYHLQSPEAA